MAKSRTLFSGRLDRKTRDSNGNRALDQFHGDDQSLIAMHRGKNSLETVESTAANPDSLPHIQERMGRGRDTPGDDSLYALDLFVGNGNADPASADKAGDAVGAQDGNARLQSLRDAHE